MKLQIQNAIAVRDNLRSHASIGKHYHQGTITVYGECSNGALIIDDLLKLLPVQQVVDGSALVLEAKRAVISAACGICALPEGELLKALEALYWQGAAAGAKATKAVQT